jgi:hypothetical protein
MQVTPVILGIQVSPQPIVLDVDPVDVSIEVSAENATAVTATLHGPGTPPTTLDLVAAAPPCDWRLSHLFEAKEQEGRWRIVVRSGAASAEQEFQVDRRGTKSETVFTAFDVQPRQLVRGGEVTVTGRLEANRGGFLEPVRAQDVVVAYLEDNTCGRREFARARTDDLGGFRATAPVRDSGQWRAEFRSTATLIGSGSVEIFVEARFDEQNETEFPSYSATRQGNATVHAGRLRTESGQWLGNKNVWVYYRPPNAPRNAYQSMNRKTVTRDTRDDRGRFRGQSGRRQGGFWRVEFHGDRLNQPSESRPDTA